LGNLDVMKLFKLYNLHAILYVFNHYGFELP